MKTIKKKAALYIADKDLEYQICTLTEIIEGERFSFEFEPDYQIIDLLPRGHFEGIQGLDLDLRKPIYRRVGIPTFISERIPPENREDLMVYLNKAGIDYYDPIELLLTMGRYAGDEIRAKEFQASAEVDLEWKGDVNTLRTILQGILSGNKVRLNGSLVDPKSTYEALYPIYCKEFEKNKLKNEKGVETRKKNDSYRGRKPYAADPDSLEQLYRLYQAKSVSLSEALRLTGWSKSTFFRKVKKIVSK